MRDIVLEYIQNLTESKLAHIRQLEFAQSCIVVDAFKKNREDKWADAYTSVSRAVLSRQTNVVGSHVVYKIKQNPNGRSSWKLGCAHTGTKTISKKTSKRTQTMRLWIEYACHQLSQHFLDFLYSQQLSKRLIYKADSSRAILLCDRHVNGTLRRHTHVATSGNCQNFYFWSLKLAYNGCWQWRNGFLTKTVRAELMQRLNYICGELRRVQ